MAPGGWITLCMVLGIAGCYAYLVWKLKGGWWS